jgi:uncharacterized protein (TIGR02001 family)
MIRISTKSALFAVSAFMAAAAIPAGMASADGLPGPAAAAPPPPPGRTFAATFNLGVTTDYIFRGVSQSRRNPAPQAGADFTYGIIYGGVWGSDIDFGSNIDGSRVGSIEVDVYGGIKPVLGPVTFDLGVIYYAYPSANDKGPLFLQVREQSYIEGKLGVSASLIPKLTTGVTVFYSPQYTGGQGQVTTVEGTVAYEFPAFYKVVPTLSGTVGGVFGDAGDANDPFIMANGKDSYTYWNVGMTFGLDKLSIDLRYWDTDIPNSGTILASDFCTGKLFGCDERFVATAKITF